MKLTFVDLNKNLCKKVKKLFKEVDNKTGFELSVFNGDVFDYKKENQSFKICTASNPSFSMGGGLDKAIAEKYPNEINNIKEFVWTDNLFPTISVDNNISSSRSIIKRCFAGIFAYRYRFDFILTGIGTSIGGLSEEDFISELELFLSADLTSANLRSADLTSANLRSADLTSANLSSADLTSANLKNIIQNELTINFNLVCPEEGDFIGWKKCNNGIIVKLLIPENSKRSSATTRKCRAEKVKVLQIFNKDGKEIKETVSNYDGKTKYVVGKITKCNNREKDRWIECGGGIHFFMTRLEAEQY